MIDRPCESWCVLRTWPEVHPGPCMRTLADASPTPAAMLGEALKGIDAVYAALKTSGALPYSSPIWGDLDGFRKAVSDAKREAEAREATAKGVAMFERVSAGLSREPKDGECLMPLPATAAEWKAQGFTYAAPETCWTTFIGAPTHRLGELPEKCLTCAAKRAEERAREACPHRVSGADACDCVTIAQAEAREVVLFVHCPKCKPVVMNRGEAERAYDRKECNPPLATAPGSGVAFDP